MFWLTDAILTLAREAPSPRAGDLTIARPHSRPQSAFLSKFTDRELNVLKDVRACACELDDPEWTHSSLMGGRDWFTHSGKLRIPERRDMALHSAIALCYKVGRPMTMVRPPPLPLPLPLSLPMPS